MAIKITNQIITDKGTTSSLYINIKSVEYNKEIGDMVVTVNVYKNQTARNNNEKCRTFVIPRNYVFDWGVDELIDNAFTVAYSKLTQKLNQDYTTEQI